MSNEAPKKLTPNDPIGKEALDKLAELESAEINTALNLKALRQEEIKLLAADRRIEDERQKLFQKILMDRGLAPNTPAQIDPATGKIILMKNTPPVQGPSAAPAQAAPSPAPTPALAGAEAPAAP